jgi:hypothetical protein
MKQSLHSHNGGSVSLRGFLCTRVVGSVGRRHCPQYSFSEQGPSHMATEIKSIMLAKFAKYLNLRNNYIMFLAAYISLIMTQIHRFVMMAIYLSQFWTLYIVLPFNTQPDSTGLSLPHRKHITSQLRAQQVNAIYRFVTMVGILIKLSQFWTLSIVLPFI